MRFGNLSATAMMMVVVLASVGCDRVESPFAPEFGVEETPRHSVSAEPPSAEDPPAAAIDAPPPSDSEAADPLVTPGVSRVEPGEPEAVMLRGPTSINTDCRTMSPLIVVDGVVLPEGSHLSDIQGLDIEQVEIVKGRAATYLYGPRAQNGAIDIQTKRGTQAAILNGMKRR